MLLGILAFAKFSDPLRSLRFLRCPPKRAPCAWFSRVLLGFQVKVQKRESERESLSIIRSLGVDRALGNVSGYVNARLNAQSTASGLLMAIRTAMHQWMAVLQM